MAKTVTVTFTDAELTSLQTVYAADDADSTKAAIKNAFIALVKNDMRAYDRQKSRNDIAYTALDPK